MKLAINLFLLLALMGGLALTAKTLNNNPMTAKLPEQAIEFPKFPTNQPVTVSFDLSAADLATLSERERMDQYRDWAFMTIVQSAGLSPSQTAEVLYDIAPLRTGYYKPVSNLEFGETRSCVFPGGLALGLIPKEGMESRDYYLAHIADQYRKNTGEIPNELLIFEYECSEESAVVTRKESIRGEGLFKEESGYFEARLASLLEFRAWFEKVDDLTYARQDGAAIVLGGRKFKDRPYRNIRVEDVAAIYQANRKLFVAYKAFEDKWKAREEELKSKWESRTYSYDFQRVELEKERDADYAQFEREYEADIKASKLTPECGFSLDPTFDYEKLLKIYDDDLAPILKGLARPSEGYQVPGSSPSVEELMKKYGVGESGRAEPSQQGINDSEPLSQKDLDTARESLVKKDADDLYRVLGKVNKLDSDVADLIESYISQSDCRFQHARYDGDLGGTEVGMVLFYTDLLAKLWALDYMSNAPRTIAGFQSMTATKLSPIYKQQERDLSSTRLWFGPQDKGFQFAGDDGTELAFSRVATRVYAAGSNPFNPGAESDPNPSSDRFLGWWNDHYEEVARYEPEYERLNAIMKWSVLTGWLDKADKGDLLDFLSTESVTKDRWFPEWVRTQPQLKFAAWERIKFFDRSNQISKTEALPILASEGFNTFSETDESHILSGGVSLGGRSLFAKRAPVTKTSAVSNLARRSVVDYTNSAGKLTTYDGTTFQFARNAGATEVSIASRQNARLRGAMAEVGEGNAVVGFGRKFVNRPDGLSIRSEIQGVAHGEVAISSNGNGFRAGWRGRELDRAFSVGRRMSQGESAEAVARSTAGVDSIKVLGDDAIAVKFENSTTWLEIRRSPTSKPEFGGSWNYRVGEFGPTVKEVRIAVADGSRIGGNVQKIGRARSEVSQQVSVAERAKQIAEDPVGYAKRVRAERAKALEEIDQALAKRDIEAARSMLDELQSVYGSSPEVGLRQAVAEIQAGKSAASVADTMGIPRGPTPEVTIQNFYKEVQKRIGTGGRSAGTSEIFEAGRCLDWRSFLSRNGGSPDSVGMAIVEGKPTLVADITGRTTGTRASSYSGDGSLYVDSVRINQIDWSPSVERSFQQCLDAGMDIVRLPVGDVAHFRPGEVYFRSQSTAKTFRLVGEPRSPVQGLPPIYLNSYQGEEDEDDKAIYVAVDRG